MPIDSGNLALKGLDDLFSTEENRQEEQREQVQQISIDALHPFTNHPFKVLDDEAMTRTVESIAQYGVLAPLIARPRPDGDGYEIISGHRRQYAAKLAGLDTLPVIVRQMSDDAAVILMVDSNLQREHILPSERAFAYKMKLDAIKNQGARSDLTSTQVAQKLSVEKVGDDAGVSKDTIRRFIRLTNLVPGTAGHGRRKEDLLQSRCGTVLSGRKPTAGFFRSHGWYPKCPICIAGSATKEDGAVW